MLQTSISFDKVAQRLHYLISAVSNEGVKAKIQEPNRSVKLDTLNKLAHA